MQQQYNSTAEQHHSAIIWRETNNTIGSRETMLQHYSIWAMNMTAQGEQLPLNNTSAEFELNKVVAP